MEVLEMDNLIEQLVKRNNTFDMTLKKVGLILATIVVSVVSLMIPVVSAFAILIIAGMIALDVFLFNRMNIEYEYVFFNGSLDIDRIANKASRKRLYSTDLKEVVIVAPTGTQELLGYQHVKVKDFSTHTPGNKTYEMVVPQGAEKIRVIFEPNAEMLQAMKDLAPRKVIL